MDSLQIILTAIEKLGGPWQFNSPARVTILGSLLEFCLVTGGLEILSKTSAVGFLVKNGKKLNRVE